jgi:hypothetical protein
MGWDMRYDTSDASKGILVGLLKGDEKNGGLAVENVKELPCDVEWSAYKKIGNTANFNNFASECGNSGPADADVYSIDLFQWDTADWKDMLSGFAMNVSNYAPLGYMVPWSYLSQATWPSKGSGAIETACGWPGSTTVTDQGYCMNPCNNVQAYNFVNNLLNYAGLMGAIFKDDFAYGQTVDSLDGNYPRILIDTARNGIAPQIFKANYQSMFSQSIAKPEPCASWCNLASTTLGQPSFTSDKTDLIHPYDSAGNKIEFISFAALKPPGESDGCVRTPLKLTNDDGENPQETAGRFATDAACIPEYSSPIPSPATEYSACKRFDTMCGHDFAGGFGATVENEMPTTVGTTTEYSYSDQTKTYMQNCPPEAGLWDLYQIDMLASNYDGIQSSDGNVSRKIATSNSGTWWKATSTSDPST